MMICEKILLRLQSYEKIGRIARETRKKTILSQISHLVATKKGKKTGKICEH